MKEKKPEFRFEGFTDAWEQRKLSGLCKLFTDGDWIESKDQSDSGIRLIQTGNIGITKYVEKQNKKWISEDTFKRLKCVEVFPGDILISRLPAPAGRACILPKLDFRAITAVDCTIIRVKDDVDVNYLVQFLSTPNYFNKIQSYLGGGTRQRISRSNLADINVLIPFEDEQQSIGSFFSTLDHLITLQQRELDYLKETKKTMLSELFPKKSETIPGIRFDGFTDAWEQRKIMEVLEERSQKSPENEEYPLMAFIANIGVAPKGDRFDRGALVKDAENKLYKQTELNDFIYSSNNLETGSIGLNRFGRASISPVYSIFKITELADANFLGRRLVRKDFINSMIRYRQGVVYGQWRIHESDFINLNLRLPNIIEQRKIGEFLDNLDHLITLQQRKLDLLKSQKQTLLKSMFPR